MHDKIIPYDAWDLGEAQTRLIKAGSRGLRGHDYTQLIKRAGHELADWARRQTIPDDEAWVHGIALGASESTGQNRNADGWKAANLRRDHPTFVKFAKPYRNHNKDPKKVYGLVKHSWFNEDMQRVELIVAYNAEKSAADRNQGLIADEELEKLSSNRDLSWSMSARVDHDICVLCGNKAKTRAEYCDENTCTYLGMKKHAGRVYDDGKIQYVDNPYSRFEDISNVRRGADRTAFVLGRVDESYSNRTPAS